MTIADLHVVRASDILTISLSRPSKKNAITRAMYTELTASLRTASTDPEIAAVIIRGEGGNLSSGNDLGDFLHALPHERGTQALDFLHALVDLKTPLLIAVEGIAIGIGVTMLLHADVVVAADNAVFRLPFIELGLCPEGASTLLLPERAGPLVAARHLLFGDVFDVAEAKRAGLVTDIVAPSQADAHVHALALQLAAKPRAALLQAKELLRAPARERLHEAINREGQAFIELLASPEATQRMQNLLKPGRDREKSSS